MAFKDCVDQVVKASGNTMARDEAERALDTIWSRAEDLKAQGLTTGDPVAQAAQEMADREALAAKTDRLQALRNQKIRDDVMAEIDRRGGVGAAAQTLHDLLRGSNVGSRESIEAGWQGRKAGWQAALDNELQKNGLQQAARRGEGDLDTAKAMWELNAGRDPGNGAAARTAKAYVKAMDMVRNRLNQAGGLIRDAVDFVTHTTHDQIKMRQAAGPMRTVDEAFNAWWGKTEPRLAETTFDGIEPGIGGGTMADARREFGRSVFESLVSGVHMVVGGGKDGKFIPPAFEGTRNLARKVSQERTLFWKDAESWHEHMQDFGRFHNLNASIMESLGTGARQLALMERLGDNPAASLNMIMRKVQEKYRGTDLDGVGKFQRKIAGINNEMGHLDGSLNVAQNMDIAQAANSIRSFESMASLGGVGLTHGASIWATVPSELAHHGINRLETMAAMTHALLPGAFADPAMKDVAADLGAFADGIDRHQQMITGDMTLPGRMSRVAGKFMDYTAIHYIFDRTKAGVRSMLAHNLARNLEKDFGALEPHLQQMLPKYGIGPEEWDLLKTAPDLPVANGKSYLTPSAAGTVDEAATEALLRRRGAIQPTQGALPAVGSPEAQAAADQVKAAVDKFRQGLTDKLLSYYGDGSAHAVVQAGVRERALLLGSTQPGTGWGEVARFLTQFKMWPVAAMNQVLGRDIHMALSNQEIAWNIGKLLAVGIPAGYLRMTLNDWALGRPHRDPFDPKTLLAAAAQSGGLGILGDFLFGETSRMGGGLVGTLGGPVVSDADQLIQIFNRFREDAFDKGGHHKQGAFGDLWPDLAHFAVRHVPFANLVYLKGSLDYLLWYHLYSAASPGWWERTNRRLQKEQGRTMQGYAPGAGVPWGVPGLYLQGGGQPATGAIPAITGR